MWVRINSGANNSFFYFPFYDFIESYLILNFLLTISASVVDVPVREFGAVFSS